MPHSCSRVCLANAAQFLPKLVEVVLLPAGKLQCILVIGCYDKSCVAVI